MTPFLFSNNFLSFTSFFTSRTKNFEKEVTALDNSSSINKLRIKFSKLFIERVSEDKRYFYVYLSQIKNFDKLNISLFINDYKNILEFNRTNVYCFKLIKQDTQNINKFDFLNKFADNFSKYLKTNKNQ